MLGVDILELLSRNADLGRGLTGSVSLLILFSFLFLPLVLVNNWLAGRDTWEARHIGVLGSSFLGLLLGCRHVAARAHTSTLTVRQALGVDGQVLLSLLWDTLGASAVDLGQLLEAGSVGRVVRALVGASAQRLVLLPAATLSRVVGGLGQPIGQIQQVLGYPDGAQQVRFLVEVVEIRRE